MNPTTVLVTTSGRDRPGVTAALFAALAAHDVEVLDVEQVVIRGRLIAGILLAVHGDPASLRHSIGQTASALGMEHEVVLVENGRPAESVADPAALLQVIVLGRVLRPGAVAAVCQRIADAGGNILTVSQVSLDRVASLELTVHGDHDALRETLAMAALTSGLDIAVQRAGLARRAKRLVMLDLEAMLLQGDGIGELATRAGMGEEAAAIASAAHSSPADSLTARVRLLAGLPLAEVWQVRDSLRWAPGVRPLIRTLKRLGYAVGVVSGGFTVLIDRLVAELGLDFVAANVLAVRDGRLTGDLVGEPIDPAGKAAALRRFAADLAVPLTQTVAIGPGAGDATLLRLAGLGIAFNAKAVRDPAGTTLSPPFLDAVLHVLGISRAELAAADLKHAESEGP
jgi:phosphoserine phosphatase